MSSNVLAALSTPAEMVLAQIAQSDLITIASEELATLKQSQGDLVQVSELESSSLGATKHFLRGKLGFAGFLVDVAWDSTEFMSALTPMVNSACASVLTA